MKLTIQGAALHAAVTWAAKIAPSRTPLPLLAGLLLDAGDSVRISATDFDTFGTAIPSGVVLDGGKALVSARLLAAITKTLGKNDEVTITADSQVEVACGRASWSLPTLGDTADYPQLPTLGDEIGRVPAEDLRRSLARVLPATSDPSVPPMRGGVAVHPASALTIAATDRYRLAVAELGWQPALGGAEQDLVVPGALLRFACDAIHDSSGEVTLHSDGNLIGLSSGTHQIMGRLLDEYATWRQVLIDPDKASSTVVTVEIPALLRAIERASVVLEREEALTLEVTHDSIRVSPAAGQVGQAEHYAELSEHCGEPITVGVSSVFLREGLVALDSPFAALNFSDNPNRPFLMRPADDNGAVLDGYQHVVMPVRLRALRAAVAA